MAKYLTFHTFRAAFLLVLIGLWGTSARAEISVSDFALEARPNRDGSVVFTETIVVHSDPAKPFTGIVRNLPKRWLSPGETKIIPASPTISFLFRNDETEPFETRETEDTLTLQFGMKSRQLQHGAHRYLLQYSVAGILIRAGPSLQVRYMIPDRWALPIQRLSTTIILPSGVVSKEIVAQIEEYEFSSGQSSAQRSVSVPSRENNFSVILSPIEANRSYIVTWNLPAF